MPGGPAGAVPSGASNGPKTIRARLVVAADGARSATREAAGLRTVSMPYSQRGVVATVSTPEPHCVAWQRFLATGPLALLPTRCVCLRYMHETCVVGEYWVRGSTYAQALQVIF